MIDRLCIAAKDGDLDTVKDLIENQKVDVNAFNPTTTEQSPPIAYAVQAGQVEMVKLLINYYKADIFYCEINPKKKHLFIWALASDKCEIIINYLIEKGLKFNLNDYYFDDKYYHYPLLHKIALSNHWDFLMSMLKKELANINIRLLYFPIEKNKHTLLEHVYRKNEKNLPIIITYLFTNFILISNAQNFKELQEKLANFKNEIAAHQVHFHLNISIILDETISLFTQLHADFVKIIPQQTFLTQNHFPKELWQIISERIVSSYLPEIHKSNSKKLIEMFENFNLPLLQKEIDEQKSLNKIAKLSYREWRFRHQHLFAIQAPTKQAVLDNYKFLQECLTEKLQDMDVPLALREKIIAEISKLDLDKFNHPNVLEAIETARAAHLKPK